MAKTRDYMDYLDDEIGIAPANSQEEFQAAESIVEVMKDHDLEPTIQEFDSRPLGALMPYILMIAMFVGILLSGIGPTGLRALGFLLTLIAAGLLYAVHSGRDLFENFGPASRSQNVIAVHRATGDKVVKGSRPIVIVAHYDTPHEGMLYNEGLAPHQVTLKKASLPCVAVIVVAAIVQLLGFVPDAVRTIAWIVGLVASLPLLLLAATEIAERFSPCTVGANDNKASVAALLSIMSKVRPGEDRVDAHAAGRAYAPRATEGDAGAEETQEPEGQPVYGTRHGKEVLQQLRILPDTCEIVYEEPKAAGVRPTSFEHETEPEEPVQNPEVTPAYEEEADGYDEAPVDDEAPQDDFEDVPDAGTYEENYDTPADDEAAGYDPAYDGTYDDYEPVGTDPVDDTAARDEVSKAGESRIKRGLQSIRRFFTRKKSDDDLTIPRGKRTGDVDFSEFEESDWDEIDDGSSYAEDELRPISREDFSAERLAWDAGGEEEYEEYDNSYNEYDDTADVDTETSDEVGETPDDISTPVTPVDDFEDDDVAEVQDDGEWESQPGPDFPSAHDGQETGSEVSGVERSDQPDWSVVEEEEVAEAQPHAFDASLYQQNDVEDDDLFVDDANDIADVEYELEEDQLTGQSVPQRRQQIAEPQPEPVGDVSVEPTDEVETAEQPSVPEEDEPTQESDELSWDDAVDEAGNDEGATAELPKQETDTAGERVRGVFGRIKESILGSGSDTNEEVDAPGEDEAAPSDGDVDADDTAALVEDSKVTIDESPEASDLRRRSRLTFDEDPDDSGILPKDTRGLDTISDSYDVYDDSSDESSAPDPIDDPTWGQSSFVPPKPKVNVARRAALFDLPDPSEDTVDPLAEDDDYYDDDEYDYEDGDEQASAETRGEDDQQDELDEADDEYDGRQGHWKGGAAVRSDLRGDDDAEDDAYDYDEAYSDDFDDGYADDTEAEALDGDAPEEDGAAAGEDAAPEEPLVIDQDDLQDAILEMGDDYLIAHDIWFVAVGSSSVAHAGIKAFLSTFRQDIRGAFLINLDCIGAGTPTVMTKEGLHAGRRSDRRLVRLFTSVADDLHIDLGKMPYDWDDTDATPAMRSRVRAVTIMGVDEHNLPALSHTQADVPENVSPQQVSSIVRLVTEAIRRA